MASNAHGGPRNPSRILLSTALSLLACSYSFSGSSVPSHIKTIAVSTFRNATLQPGLERELTDAVLDVFEGDNRLNVAGTGSADAVVEGEIIEYDHSVFGLGNTNQAEEYRVTIKLNIVVKDRVKGKDLWQKRPMVGQSTYRLNATGDVPRSESAAREDAVRKLAEDVLANTLEEW